MSENDQIEQKHRDAIHKVVNGMSTSAQEQFAKVIIPFIASYIFFSRSPLS